MVAGKSKIFMVGQKTDPGKNQYASQTVGRISLLLICALLSFILDFFYCYFKNPFIIVHLM